MFGKGEDYLNEHAHTDVKESRDLLVEFCWKNELTICNTYKQKTNDKKVTYRPPKTIHGPPWNEDQYEQIDFIITNQKWRNTCKNCETDTKHCLNSDHYMLTATFRTTLAKPKNKQHFLRKYWPPNETQLQQYNDKIEEYYKQNNNEHSIEQLNNICNKTIQDTFSEKPTTIKKCYISQNTWQLIQQRQWAYDNKQNEQYIKLNKEIKKEV